MTALEIIGTLISGGAAWKFGEYLLLKRKTRAETHKIEIETDNLASNQWKQLFAQVSKEWEQAKRTIAQNVKDIIQLKEDLRVEREECNKKLNELYLKIENGNHKTNN